MMMVSDLIEKLFKEMKKEDLPVNILINNKLYDIKKFYYDENINEYILELTEGYNYKNNKKERYKYNPKSQNIIDIETGYTYHCNDKNIVKLLNQL